MFHVGGALVHVFGASEHRLVFKIWRLEHCGCTNAYLKVVSIVLCDCNA